MVLANVFQTLDERSLSVHSWHMTNALSVSVTAAVAAEVRAEVARKQISQDKLAAQVGCSRQSLNRRLTGATPFDVAELAAIAEALGVPVTQFLPTPVRAA